MNSFSSHFSYTHSLETYFYVYHIWITCYIQTAFVIHSLIFFIFCKSHPNDLSTVFAADMTTKFEFCFIHRPKIKSKIRIFLLNLKEIQKEFIVFSFFCFLYQFIFDYATLLLGIIIHVLYSLQNDNTLSKKFGVFDMIENCIRWLGSFFEYVGISYTPSLLLQPDPFWPK